jgi:uncharacterized protein
VRVAELWRYPVKSLRGERLERVDVLGDGFRGDRLTRILGADGSHLTGRTATGLLGLQAELGANEEPLIEGDPWDSAPARERIEAAAGGGSRLTPLGRHFDAVPILVVTDGAVGRLGEDRRRLRPNVVVEGVHGLAERNWVGRRLRLGATELFVRERCERCVMTTIDPDTLEIDPDVLRRINADFEGTMGIYCEVARPGPLRVGDPVELL